MSKERNLELLAMDHGALEALTLLWQRTHGLVQDGDPGPKTRRSIRTVAGAYNGEPGPLAVVVLEVARSELGNGEIGGDNLGPCVAKYQGVDDTGKPLGSWCAGFVGWCIEEACSDLGMVCPVQRISWARSLFSRVRRAGMSVDKPIPGDIVLFERGDPGGSSHIGIVEDLTLETLHTIEGNVGRPPAKVKRCQHRVYSDRILGFARLP